MLSLPTGLCGRSVTIGPIGPSGPVNPVAPFAPSRTLVPSASLGPVASCLQLHRFAPQNLMAQLGYLDLGGQVSTQSYSPGFVERIVLLAVAITF